MRVAVEGLGATVGPTDGAGRYLLGLLHALGRTDAEVSAFVGPSMRPFIPDGELAEIVVAEGGRARRIFAQHVGVPRAARRERVDAVIYLGNYAPIRPGPPAVSVVMNLLLAVDDPLFGGARTSYGRFATLQGVRDLGFGYARAKYRSFARNQLARSADRVIAVSRLLADALERATPALSGHVEVIHPPVDIARVGDAVALPVHTPPTPYFLAVGRPWAYRDYGLTLEALARSGLEHALVVVGEAPAPERAPLEADAKRLNLDGRLQFAGAVTDPGELRAWYEGSAALIASSKVEAYPFTPGEAMAVGTPVIAVNRTAYPEMIGGAGLLVEPDPDELAAAMRDAMDPQKRQRLISAGRRRAGELSWERYAHRLLEVCREVSSRT